MHFTRSWMLISLQSLNKDFFCRAEPVVFINNSHTITCQYYLQCHVWLPKNLLPSFGGFHGLCCELLASVSDLFIHVNPILNGWLQSFLFTVLSEEPLLLFFFFFFQGSHYFLFLPPPPPETELQSEGNLISIRMSAFCKHTVEYLRRFKRFPSHFSLSFLLIIHPSPFKGNASDCSYNASALELDITTYILLMNNSFKCMFTTARQSTWKCLLYASAQLHKARNLNHFLFK